MLETITASFAAMGLAAKAGIAGAAVVATTAGAGAAGALPDTLQGSFDNVVRGVEQSDDAPETDDVQVSEEPAEIETPDGGVDGTEISETAKNGGVDGLGTADDAAGDNGADGRGSAEEAQENAPELPGDADADEGRERAEDGKANADDVPAGSDAADDRPEAPVEQPDTDEQPQNQPDTEGFSTQGDDTDTPVETPADGGADTAPGADAGR